jgi:hypothetical protein
MSAIFLHSVSPPAAAVSGWMMSIAPESKISRNPYLHRYSKYIHKKKKKKKVTLQKNVLLSQLSMRIASAPDAEKPFKSIKKGTEGANTAATSDSAMAHKLLWDLAKFELPS